MDRDAQYDNTTDNTMVLKTQEPLFLRMAKRTFISNAFHRQRLMEMHLQGGGGVYQTEHREYTDSFGMFHNRQFSNMSEWAAQWLAQEMKKDEHRIEDAYYKVDSVYRTAAPTAAMAFALSAGPLLHAQEKEWQVIGTTDAIEARYGTQNRLAFLSAIDVKKSRQGAEFGLLALLPHEVEVRIAATDRPAGQPDAFGMYGTKKIGSHMLLAGHEESGAQTRDYVALRAGFGRLSVGAGAILESDVRPAFHLGWNAKKMTAGAAWNPKEKFGAEIVNRAGMPFYATMLNANGTTSWNAVAGLAGAHEMQDENFFRRITEVRSRRMLTGRVPNEGFSYPIPRQWELPYFYQVGMNVQGSRGRSNVDDIEVTYSPDGWKQFDRFLVGAGYRREETPHGMRYKNKVLLGAKIGPFDLQVRRTGNAGEFSVVYRIK